MDLFDSALTLEEQHIQEGHDDGVRRVQDSAFRPALQLSPAIGPSQKARMLP